LLDNNHDGPCSHLQQVAKKKEKDNAALDAEMKKRRAERGEDEDVDDEAADILAEQQDEDVIF